MAMKKKRRRKSKWAELGKPGDVVLGRTNDGRSWSATIGKNGRLIKKVLEDW